MSQQPRWKQKKNRNRSTYYEIETKSCVAIVTGSSRKGWTWTVLKTVSFATPERGEAKNLTSAKAVALKTFQACVRERQPKDHF